MHPADGKPQPSDTDPEKLARLLEIELMQKRVAWQRAGERRNVYRLYALLFLVLVIAGAIAAYFFLVGGMPDRAPERQPPGNLTR